VIKVALGTETNFVLEKTVFNKKSQPYSDCVENRYNSKDTEWVSFTIQRDGIYVQKRCIRNCADKLNAESNVKSCAALNDSSLECLTGMSNLTNYFVYCSNFCPIECSYSYFTYSTMQSNFPSANYAKLLLNDPKLIKRFTYYPASNVTYDRLTNSILKVNIFFRTISVHTFTEQAEMVFDTLLANLGGQLVCSFLLVIC
jgi:hypothetical protein